MSSPNHFFLLVDIATSWKTNTFRKRALRKDHSGTQIFFYIFFYFSKRRWWLIYSSFLYSFFCSIHTCISHHAVSWSRFIRKDCFGTVGSSSKRVSEYPPTVFVSVCSMWDLCSLSRDWTYAPCCGSMQSFLVSGFNFLYWGTAE